MKIKISPTLTVTYNTGSSLEEALHLFGPQLVFAKYIYGIEHTLSKQVSRWRDAGLSDQAIAERLSTYKPTLRLRSRLLRAAPAELRSGDLQSDELRSPPRVVPQPIPPYEDDVS